MKYYEWISDNIRMPDGDCWYIDFPIGSYNGVWFSECKRIDDWNERLIATYPQCNFIHVDFQPCRYPVLSERFFTHLNAIAPGTIQFLPFRMQQADGSNEITGYGLGQILNRVDCLDKERTQVADGVWRSFPPLGNFHIRGDICLRRQAVRDHQIFRVLGTSSKLVVREDIKETVAAHGFTGCRFIELRISE